MLLDVGTLIWEILFHLFPENCSTETAHTKILAALPLVFQWMTARAIRAMRGGLLI